MVKITLTNGEKTEELNGKTVVAFILDPATPEGVKEDASSCSAVMGIGNMPSILLNCAVALGTLVNNTIKSDLTKALLTSFMKEAFEDGVKGEGHDVEVVKDTRESVEEKE